MANSGSITIPVDTTGQEQVHGSPGQKNSPCRSSPRETSTMAHCGNPTRSSPGLATTAECVGIVHNKIFQSFSTLRDRACTIKSQSRLGSGSRSFGCVHNSLFMTPPKPVVGLSSATQESEGAVRAECQGPTPSLYKSMCTKL